MHLTKSKQFIYVIYSMMIMFSSVSYGQDFTFSQSAQLRQVTNPARIGSFREDFRISGGYRNQWYASGNPYNVVNLNGELNFFPKKLRLDKIGTMVGLVQDQMGNGALKTTYISAGTSVFTSLDPVKRHQISVGIQASWQMRELNPGSFTYNNQFDPVQRIFDGAISSGESFGSRKQTYLQISLGASYYFQMSERTRLQLNGSFIGLNSLQETFSTLPDIATASQKKRFTIGAEANHIVSDRISIDPFVFYNRQGPSQELVLGSWVNIQSSGFVIAPGLFYRINDAVIPGVRFEKNRFAAALTYDVTHTSAVKASNKEKLIGLGGFGALEFTLSYRGIFRKKTGSRLTIPCRTF
ncbi:MAG TPA: PorP/SprF family type IX secretion system membrane protein [Catalimonadaceae bacterium]|nr:PorP/SprF family type IX secretion system membrane protein [Catalimonadaceae bacterium]HPI09509.1 PorP/SprF family type IX secretion system membrane protein [Catalimonadaceae bacterium]